jgi:hypothetical protein
MKKTFGITVLMLIFISCITFGKGQQEFQYSVVDFQGTWEQVDGSSVITITGNNFTILNMEIGYAGYGRISMEIINHFVKAEGKEIKIKTIKFICDSSTKGNIMYLGNSEETINEINSGKHFYLKDSVFINDFQMKAWKEFSPISEKNGKFSDDVIEKYFINQAFYQKHRVHKNFCVKGKIS